MDVKDSEWNDEQNSGNDVGGVHLEWSRVFGVTMATKP